MNTTDTNSEYQHGRVDERQAIINKIREKGYDWSHDSTFSPLQHLLNWFEEENQKK